MTQPVFILATGPSQNQADIDRVRGLGTVIAINNAMDYAPWADILYAADEAWLRTYNHRSFKGRKLTICKRGADYGFEVIPFHNLTNKGFGRTVVRNGHNGGFHMLNWGLIHEAGPFCLLGYDFQHTNGKRHCHDDHPQGMGNMGALDLHVRAMNIAAMDTFGKTVVNCTRETALTCFPRMDLEAFISEYCDIPIIR